MLIRKLFFALFFLLLGCENHHMPNKHDPKLVINESSGDLKLGVSIAKITPTEAMRKSKEYYLAGYGKGRTIAEINDDVWARTVVFEQNGKSLAVVTFDVIGYHHHFIDRYRSRLAEKAKVDYLIVHSTHNHSGPDTLGMWGKSFFTTGITDGYIEYIEEKMTESIVDALAKLTPVQLKFYSESVADLDLVKDYRKPYVIPNLLTTISAVDQSTGQPITHIVHFDCHPEALGPKNLSLTSDYPHYLREVMEEESKLPVVYWTGIVGGLMAPKAQKLADGKELKEGTFELSEFMGKELGKRALTHLQKSENVKQGSFKVAAEIFDLSLENNFMRLGSWLGVFPRDFPSWGTIRTEMAHIQIGDLTIQTVPGELYPELVYGPLDPPAEADYPDAPREEPVLKTLIPGKHKLLMGLAQDELGYVIPANGWDEEEPYLEDSYGEELSVSIKAAREIHDGVRRLMEVM